ncbi:FAD:protein FMN transferase [Acinetobacter sp. B5B]|uniref:FAD:protein FMN transferase n=1 Tax=Acinetobacter baretiae TaxID=2605383 RepID=UPI0018C21C1B|nr:FAD:protein FMN transferase [Acinetobacter baretiae]MBF7682125.1 FAD:protein FMN transferase [Acinetobacter baretiae]MBF7684632.1 FAD:protein FMN transferase [Acinetobacter baretiae]
MLGTYVEIHVALSGTKKSVEQIHFAISKAYEVIQKVQSLMSFHDESSALNQLNARAHLSDIQTDPWLYALLQRAKKIYDHSHGLFDCTIAPTLIEYGFLPKHHFHQTFNHIDVSQQDVMLLPENKIRFKQPLCLDLGGIAKGFAVDLAIHQLRSLGIKNAVVNAGGDLRVVGDMTEQIYLRDSSQPQYMQSMGYLSNGAIATSGSYFSKRIYKKNAVSHFIHPLTHSSVFTEKNFTVLAPQAWLADALTKVLVLAKNTEHVCFKRFGAQVLIT